jgi:hypothetical protein
MVDGYQGYALRWKISSPLGAPGLTEDDQVNASAQEDLTSRLSFGPILAFLLG